MVAANGGLPLKSVQQGSPFKQLTLEKPGGHVGPPGINTYGLAGSSPSGQHACGSTLSHFEWLYTLTNK